MDTNLVNCVQCGHSVSQTAKACAYCGAVVSEGEPTLQNDESIAAEEVASVEPASWTMISVTGGSWASALSSAARRYAAPLNEGTTTEIVGSGLIRPSGRRRRPSRCRPPPALGPARRRESTTAPGPAPAPRRRPQP